MGSVAFANVSTTWKPVSSHISERVDTTAYTTQEEAQGREQEVNSIQQEIHTREEEQQGLMGQEEHSPQEEDIQAVVQAVVAHLQAQHLHS